MSKDIILINHYAGSPRMGMEFRPYYMMKHIEELGHSTLTIAGSYSHLRKVQPSSLGYMAQDGIDYYVMKTVDYKGNGVKRLISMLQFSLKLALKAFCFARRHKPKAVIASSTYPLDIFGAYLIVKFARAKLIFEIHDLWPLSPMEIGGMSEYHPFIMLMRFAEWFAYKMSDEIISILPNTFQHVAKDGVKAENWHYIPNGYVPDNGQKGEFVLASELASIKAKYKRVVMFCGGLVPSSNIQFIVDVFGKCKDCSLVIVGDGPLINTTAESNVYFVGSIPKYQVELALGYADFAVFSLIHSPLYNYGTSLNKLCDYMYAKKPIIQLAARYNTEVEQAQCGFVIDETDCVIAAMKIKELMMTPKGELRQIAQRGYNFLVLHRNYTKLAKQFLAAIKVSRE